MPAHHRSLDRLAQAVPLSQTLLTQAAERGHPLGRIIMALLSLLDCYGVSELEAGIQEAVRLALERRREARELPPPVEITLSSQAQSCDKRIPVLETKTIAEWHLLKVILFYKISQSY